MQATSPTGFLTMVHISACIVRKSCMQNTATAHGEQMCLRTRGKFSVRAVSAASRQTILPSSMSSALTRTETTALLLRCNATTKSSSARTEKAVSARLLPVSAEVKNGTHITATELRADICTTMPSEKRTIRFLLLTTAGAMNLHIPIKKLTAHRSLMRTEVLKQSFAASRILHGTMTGVSGIPRSSRG